MNIYHVTGKICYPSGYRCRCGCGNPREYRDKIDQRVEAETEQEALDKILERSKARYGYREGKDWVYWSDDGAGNGPKVEFIREVGQEDLMLRAGYMPLWKSG